MINFFGYNIPTSFSDILLTPSFWAYVIIVIALIVVEHVISWAARRSVVRLNLPKSAANSLIIVVRLVLVIIAVALALPVFGAAIPSELLVAITASLATAIALFVSFSLQNVVSGIYLLATRPFAVGDYVKIGDTEGIVEEISVNYTTIYTPNRSFAVLPNQTVLNNPIINYRIRERYYEEFEPQEKGKKSPKKEELAAQAQKQGRLKRLSSEQKKIREAIIARKLYGYIFEVVVRYDEYNRKKMEAAFEHVCKKWEPTFKYTPEFRLWKIDWYVLYRFRITVENPVKIIDHRHEFLEDVLQVIKPEKS